ncbi:hypothetical protein AJ85_18185 [Alkalihalobacillus alcalophilus ATCC 27647 = CGMCC 1.3604]|uniref:UPF0178 protein AJ85_18185 n=1 Tax=Alkalihalobacillus alcalophilus ATCC 27647 = CGMCC 1.3604 TaxID=1218173 RepID=A0A4S4JW07_ALKAL|nr:YaiI/YqxD family protein [Alkalihalobacillus alcalophilus]THG89358.1 hypothetical protein AJ85_18185 [Alkalihalobacillus alcalophilus ATCC 27647 = CGMCC 1.3604]
MNLFTMDKEKRTIYVDADSCPVKEEVLLLAAQYKVPTTFVSSYAHQLTLPAFVEQVTVDTDKEAVDLYVMNQVKKGDICVTQDHALASLLLAKGTLVLSPKGYLFKEETIQQLLDFRFLSQKERRMGGRTKGPKAFTKKDRQFFLENLEKIIKK